MSSIARIITASIVALTLLAAMVVSAGCGGRTTGQTDPGILQSTSPAASAPPATAPEHIEEKTVEPQPSQTTGYGDEYYSPPSLPSLNDLQDVLPSPHTPPPNTCPT